MNAGLASLTYLKIQLLAEKHRIDAAYDAPLTAIGLGVALLMEKFCNRQFERTVDATVEFPGDRDTLCVPRLPLESISALALASDYATGFEATDLTWIASVDNRSGVVQFTGNLGTHLQRARLTYTGGWWWDTSEDASGALPSGATALPADVLLAWVMQCKKCWEVFDAQGTGIAKGGSNVSILGLSLAGLDLLPLVKQTLQPHIRYALS